MHRHHVWPIKSGLVVAVINGVSTAHASLEEAVRYYGPYTFRVSDDGETLLRGSWLSCGVKIRIFDRWGREFKPEEVVARAEAIIVAARRARRRRIRGHGYDPATFRRGPVPHTGKRGGYGGWRHIKTTQERRASCAAEADEDVLTFRVKLRARRNAVNLVNAWDDVARHVERNWKRHRRTQWK